MRRLAPAPAETEDPYRVTAEFYDLFHRDRYHERAERQLAAAAAAASAGILEVGAGTGVVTEVLAAAGRVPIHAVEPSRAMRSVLLARLQAAPLLRSQVCVHAVPVDELAGIGPVDLAVCVNLLPSLAPPDRPALLDSIRALLRPGGLLAVDSPWQPSPRPGTRELPSVRIGADEYTGSVTIESLDGVGRLRLRYRYLVWRGPAVAREETTQFDLWPLTPADLCPQLEAAGFDPQPVPRPATNGVRFFRRR